MMLYFTFVYSWWLGFFLPTNVSTPITRACLRGKKPMVFGSFQRSNDFFSFNIEQTKPFPTITATFVWVVACWWSIRNRVFYAWKSTTKKVLHYRKKSQTESCEKHILCVHCNTSFSIYVTKTYLGLNKVHQNHLNVEWIGHLKQSWMLRGDEKYKVLFSNSNYNLEKALLFTIFQSKL